MADILSLLAQPLAPTRNPNDWQLINQGIGAIGQGIQNKRLMERQERVDAQNKTTQDLQNTRLQQQINAEKAAIEASGQKSRLKDYGKDLIVARALYDTQDFQGVADLLTNRIESANEFNRGPHTEKRDPQDSVGLLNTLNQNPTQFRALLDAEIEGLERTEVLKSTPSQFEQGRGAMEGYVFNKKDGSFSIDQQTKAIIDADTAALKAEEGMLKPDKVAGINDKVTSLGSDAWDAYAAAQAMEALQGRGSPAAKIGAIFKFMKALDPSSTVRESEGRMVMFAEGAMAGFAQAVNELMGEGPLSETNFADLVKTSKTLANSASQSAGTAIDRYLGVLKDKVSEEDFEELRARIPPTFSDSATQGDEDREFPDGTIIRNRKGERMIMRGGQWEPLNG